MPRHHRRHYAWPGDLRAVDAGGAGGAWHHSCCGGRPARGRHRLAVPAGQARGCGGGDGDPAQLPQRRAGRGGQRGQPGELGRRHAGRTWRAHRRLRLEAKAAWVAYRQQLRDITEQADFPQVVEWPVEPASV
ncbi:MAG: hypothetical protein CVU73_12035 [Deltaproteobacteria bacterium HGW-Deltaproteobacteria-8]|nr:MAG: hypothetical protein CVU73_12035 [Deltaproteobacteria bacterium HGW-Deltaproteobacteria-8]